MAIVYNGTGLNWYTDTIVLNGTTVSSPSVPGDVYFDGTKVWGLDGTYETTLHAGTTIGQGFLRPDSADIEDEVVPILNNYAEAFWDRYYTDPPPGDVRYQVFLKPGYRLYTQDGTFNGSASPGTAVYFWSGQTVTGINTSHNGGTWWYLQRDNGV